MALRQQTAVLLMLSGIIMVTCHACSVDMVETRAGCCCPTYWTAYKHHCYRLFSYQKTWHEAESFCRSFAVPSTGYDQAVRESIGHLVSIHSRDEHDFITTLFESSRIKEIPGGTAPTSVWLGAHDTISESMFEWTDGTSFDFSMWAPNQPSDSGSGEDCGQIRSDFGSKWNDQPCDSTSIYYIICKMPIWYLRGSVTTSRLQHNNIKNA